ncbi:MAG: HlyD family efflux transporter periplasmic adaptor subunit [Chloroflexi bacterium]|nr:HlyD family efflux transporter periplasmic adaptor subunit [Chloroflexota bacterium]
MTNRRLLTALGLIVLVALGYFGYTRRATPPATPPSDQEEAGPAVIWASGIVVPAEHAMLAFPIAGRIAGIEVTAGESVQRGQALVRLDDTDLTDQVAQAEAALAQAEGQLAQLRAGPRPPQIAAANARVEAATAAVTQAEQNAQAAKAQADVAQHTLAQLQKGARPEDIASAKADLQKAEGAVRQAQAAYDPIAGLPDAGARPESLALQTATLNLEQAQAAYDKLISGATADEISAAKAQLAVAQAQAAAAEAAVLAAQARAEEAHAARDLLLAGASPDELDVARAQVSRAEATLRQARHAREKATLTAPFDGIIGKVYPRLGELVSPAQPIVAVGDLTQLQVETTDLRETDVNRIRVGQKVELTFDALPDKTLTGQIVHIAPMATQKEGSTNYTTIISVDEGTSLLRWGMTAFVNIVPQDSTP